MLPPAIRDLLIIAVPFSLIFVAYLVCANVFIPY